MTQGVLKVNDRVIGVNLVCETQYNGMQGIVLEDCGVGKYVFSDDFEDEVEVHAFRVEWANGDETCTIRSNLKRKKPPTTDNKSGEEIVFDLFQCRQQFLEECA